MLRHGNSARLVFLVDAFVGWSADWAWGLLLIVVTLLIHVFGLTLIRLRVVHHFNRISQMHHPTAAFVAILGATTLSTAILHAAEAGIWAFGLHVSCCLAGLQNCGALLAERHDKLWAHEYQSARPLAPYGSARGAEWVAAVRAYNGVSVRLD